MIFYLSTLNFCGRRITLICCFLCVGYTENEINKLSARIATAIDLKLMFQMNCLLRMSPGVGNIPIISIIQLHALHMLSENDTILWLAPNRKSGNSKVQLFIQFSSLRSASCLCYTCKTDKKRKLREKNLESVMSIWQIVVIEDLRTHIWIWYAICRLPLVIEVMFQV